MRSSEEKITIVKNKMHKKLDTIREAIFDGEVTTIDSEVAQLKRLNDELDEEICNYEDEIGR